MFDIKETRLDEMFDSKEMMIDAMFDIKKKWSTKVTLTFLNLYLGPLASMLLTPQRSKT